MTVTEHGYVARQSLRHVQFITHPILFVTRQNHERERDDVTAYLNVFLVLKFVNLRVLCLYITICKTDKCLVLLSTTCLGCAVPLQHHLSSHVGATSLWYALVVSQTSSADIVLLWWHPNRIWVARFVRSAWIFSPVPSFL